ncbi:hypothetical protein B0H14DRAFT_105493 [Mycena olivaceomarginata]|nr:hypothetical protein B0H14DRAFT_105493 [Mycena olivaceomarginata]
MSSTHSLLVHSLDGFSWKPCPLRRKKPNLFVAIYQDGVEQRTPAVKRYLTPKWEHLLKLATDSDISVRLFHASGVPTRKLFLASADITFAALLDLCSDGKTAALALAGVDGLSNGNSAGKLHVRLMQVEATKAAVAKMPENAAKLVLGSKSSAVIAAANVVNESASPLTTAFQKLNSKLEVIVNIGDKIAMIHPIATMAWTVLSAVYKVVKHQKDNDTKLCKLVDAVLDTYSLLGDIDSLPGRIESVEDTVLLIVKQTFECALFIQEYIGHGFCNRAIRSIWADPSKTIDDLSEKMARFRASLDTNWINIQSCMLTPTGGA